MVVCRGLQRSYHSICYVMCSCTCAEESAEVPCLGLVMAVLRLVEGTDSKDRLGNL